MIKKLFYNHIDLGFTKLYYSRFASKEELSTVSTKAKGLLTVHAASTEAHTEIRVTLPNGDIFILPAKNAHVFKK